MVELHNADSHGFVLLSLYHKLPELDVSDQFDTNYVVEVDGLCQVPPVLTGQRSIDIVAEALRVKK